MNPVLSGLAYALSRWMREAWFGPRRTESEGEPDAPRIFIVGPGPSASVIEERRRGDRLSNEEYNALRDQFESVSLWKRISDLVLGRSLEKSIRKRLGPTSGR